MYKKELFIALVAISNILFAQNNTSNPYSIFGIGLENKTSTGNLTALGNTGIANDNSFQVNITNPASLGNIIQKSFLYEFGANGSYTSLKNENTTETKTNGNISHIAIAFPVKHNWGVGIGLLPLTKVGYNITTENDIEGSTEEYLSFIQGEGGLNKFYIATGVKLGKTLSLGLDASFLFGAINQQTQLFSSSLFTIDDNTYYSGMKLKTGFQYAFFNSKKQKTSIGGTLEIPVSLNGERTRTSYQTTTNGQVIPVEAEVEYDVNDFDLPIISGIGITSNIYKDFTASFDYKKLLWNETDQGKNNDQYYNQDIYAFGLELAPSKQKLKYYNRLKYRFGFNYNTGFLNISNRKIDSYFVSLGAGIPLDQNARNIMNLSYSYGKEGTTDNNLVQENFHRVTLNLSFIGNWFKERKIF